MGYQVGKSAPSLLRMNYERFLYPYDIFQAGAFTGDPPPSQVDTKKEEKDKERDKDYIPNCTANTNYQMSRRSKKLVKAEDEVWMSPNALCLADRLLCCLF